MKILIFSDSHGMLSFMRHCIETVRPDAVVHLGDHYSDYQDIQEEFPQLIYYAVPGNCDLHRAVYGELEIKVPELFGVRFYMTHGHKHGVKMGLYRLLADARAAGAQAVLYGHTHIPLCRQEEDGLWVLNPGPATWGGGAGLITTAEGKIQRCDLLCAADLK